MGKKVGIIGWRGMVGSVLLQRMREEQDFKHMDAYFFSTSQKGEPVPTHLQSFTSSKVLRDAFSLDDLREMEILISCQGGSYTDEMHLQLRDSGWQGHWVDAASSLRMKENSLLVLDPLNKTHIENHWAEKKDLIGANCTVSLMLMALAGLFREDLIEWVSSMTYQAASGAGAKNMLELVKQMGFIAQSGHELLQQGESSILAFDEKIRQALHDKQFPQEQFQTALAGSLIPWIDAAVEEGRSREEWKGMVETNKILTSGLSSPVKVDGTCVRVGAMRCHSQGLTIKLKKTVELSTVENLLKTAHEWVDFVPNNREETIQRLNPKTYTSQLKIGVGRVRPMAMGREYLNVFTTGDQLLWGAAEPLRRVTRGLIHGSL